LRAKYQEKSIACLNKDYIKMNYNHFNSKYKFSLKAGNLNNHLLNQINYQGLNGILHYEDTSSMQQSIEMRSPFLDYRLMEFAFSIPKELLMSKGISKVIQRETIGKMLPDSISKTRNKIGFTTPFIEYIENDKHMNSYIFDVLNSKSFNSKTIWKADIIIKAFKSPKKYPNFPFWRFINLELWSKMYNITNL
jgi:asparagine synthase (glutamine-hydrolysing)